MLNILVFGQSFLGKIGGVQQSYAWLYEYLVERGHKITHITHLPEGENGLYYPFPGEVEIGGINLLFGKNPQEEIRRFARDLDPDVILIVNSGMRALQFALPLYSLPYPVVLSERGSPEYCITQLWRSRRLHELAVFASDFLHMLMPSYPLSLPDWLRERARVISSLTMPAKIFADPDLADSSGRFYILYTGRFSDEKRLSLLVDAFSLLAGKFPDWDLCLVGAGPEQEAIEGNIREKGLEERIFLPGYANAPEILQKYYASSHIYCLPSSFEGCPLALREAMAHALPVIGFASCPGTNEIITPGRNGLLAPEDNPESLAKQLELLMRDGKKRKAMGLSGAQDVQKYAPEKTHAAWENLLLEAAAWKGRRNVLRRRRFLRNPLPYLFAGLQTRSLETGRRNRDIFAKSPWHWFARVGRNPLDYSLLNILPFINNLLNRINREEIMNYESAFARDMKNHPHNGLPASIRCARNIAALSALHGIRWQNLYGLAEKDMEAD